MKFNKTTLIYRSSIIFFQQTDKFFRSVFNLKHDCLEPRTDFVMNQSFGARGLLRNIKTILLPYCSLRTGQACRNLPNQYQNSTPNGLEGIAGATLQEDRCIAENWDRTVILQREMMPRCKISLRRPRKVLHWVFCLLRSQTARVRRN